MRVYIAVDMEGIAGIVHEEQTRPHAPEYARSCRLMTAEANAAVEGALAAGATKVVVSDCHWDMRNILPEELHPAAELIQGSPRPWSMMQGIDDGFDAACFVGFHTRAGVAEAVIDHTYTTSIADVRINGRAIGEIGLNAALAGYHGVPTVLVSGDHNAVAEAEALIGPSLVGVPVKHGLARYAARSLAPSVAREQIQSGVARALGSSHQPFRLDGTLRLEVDFLRTSQADLAGMLPGGERTGPRTVAYTHNNYLMVFKAWRALFILGNAD